MFVNGKLFFLAVFYDSKILKHSWLKRLLSTVTKTKLVSCFFNYIYIQIFIQKQYLSFYHNSSVQFDTRDPSSWDRNFTPVWYLLNYIHIDNLSVIWKSVLTDKMKRSCFQAVTVSILLYGYTTWTLIKRREKKLDGNYTRMLRAIMNRSWRQHPTKQQLYGRLPPITKIIQVRRTRHAGHDELSAVLFFLFSAWHLNFCKNAS